MVETFQVALDEFFLIEYNFGHLVHKKMRKRCSNNGWKVYVPITKKNQLKRVGVHSKAMCECRSIKIIVHKWGLAPKTSCQMTCEPCQYKDLEIMEEIDMFANLSMTIISSMDGIINWGIFWFI